MIGLNVTETIQLPAPRFESLHSLESTIRLRRSIRDYTHKPLSLVEVSQLLWAAQGITTREGYRTVPSAGALYPLEVSVVAGNVQNLHAGIYRYLPSQHELVITLKGDKRSPLSAAALRQDFIRNSAAVLVISAVSTRTSWKYGHRSDRYIHMEVGHAAQNISLQAEALNLGTVVVGAFDDDRVKQVMNMPDEEEPLTILPVGRKK